VLGLVGTGKASIDLFNAFWDGLSEEQKQELKQYAFNAGLQLSELRVST
jgi:TRAP-type C4-dicarboxylate transport system substrate-binding protein